MTLDCWCLSACPLVRPNVKRSVMRIRENLSTSRDILLAFCGVLLTFDKVEWCSKYPSISHFIGKLCMSRSRPTLSQSMESLQWNNASPEPKLLLSELVLSSTVCAAERSGFLFCPIHYISGTEKCCARALLPFKGELCRMQNSRRESSLHDNIAFFYLVHNGKHS